MTALRRMTDKSLRVVFAIYSSGEEAERAFRSVCSAGRGRDCLLLTANAKPSPRSKLRHYAALQLDGENVVLVAATSSRVQAIVKELRTTGEPSVFMLAEGAPDAPPERIAVPLSSIAEMARHCSERRNSSPLFKNEILARLKDCETRLEAVRQNLAEAARLDHTLTASAEWLLDNAYLSRTSIAEIRRSLPRDRIRAHSGQYGYLCVYELAAELARYSDHSLGEANIFQALTEYQRWTTLSIAELWSFPLLLRLSLIESLAILAQGVDHAQQIRETGYFWANRLAASSRREPEWIPNLWAGSHISRPAWWNNCRTKIARSRPRSNGSKPGWGCRWQKWFETNTTGRPPSACQSPMHLAVSAHSRNWILQKSSRRPAWWRRSYAPIPPMRAAILRRGTGRGKS